MADKKLNEVTKVTDMAYVPVIMSDGSIGKIAKADLATVVAGLMFRGNIKTLDQFINAIRPGTYYYSGGYTAELGTSNFGVVCVFVANNYISQLLIGPILTWRMSYNGGEKWDVWKNLSIS